MTWMRWLLLAFAALLAAAFANAAETPALRAVEREELLRQGESALAGGNVEAALQAFERAAAISHAADTEMGLVRAYMQGGEYRRALAFVAHTAGAHREVPGSTVLYAWLLHLGGQSAAAKRMLDEARARFPGEAIVHEVHEQLAAAAPRVTPLMLQAPARLAPYAPGALPAGARVAGNGVLIDHGRRALVPAAFVEDDRRLWVRNGLGGIAQGEIEMRLSAEGVAVVRLDPPLPDDPELRAAPQIPFPGAPAFAVAHTASDATPAWPLLASGFLGRTGGATSRRELMVALPAGHAGGPVFDASGRWLGIALPGRGASGRLLTAARLRETLGELAGDIAPKDSPRVSADRIYEGALRTALQVIAVR